MTLYTVKIPITGYISALIDADDEDEALEKAMDCDYENTDIEEWDITETIVQGRMFYGILNNAEVTEVML